MRKFNVSWKSKTVTGSSVYEGKSQVDVLMKIMRTLSPDGIHAPECVIRIIPM